MSKKKDFRIYCDEEYVEYLKQVASEQGISVNRLVMDLVEKRYPMPKKKSHKTDVRIYISDEQKEVVKMAAEARGISVNQLLMELINKKYPYDKKAQAALEARIAEATLPLPNRECECQPEREDISLLSESVNNQNETDTAVSSEIRTDELTREQQEARLKEVSAILRKAFNGDKLPKDEFQRLHNEQKELRAILGHN